MKAVAEFSPPQGNIMISRRLIASALQILSLSGFAVASGACAQAETLDTSKIITALTGDWNGDGARDLVLIAETKPGDPMDVHFFLRDKEHNYLKPVEVVHDQVTGEWNGFDQSGYENSDTEPELSALPNGSILLKIPALPVGSQRTDLQLTIAYRHSQFVVAGFAYDYTDYFKDSAARHCEYNLLTGKGIRTRINDKGVAVKRPVAVEGKEIAFKQWMFSNSLTDCGGDDP
jgi:hypothetical protein